jgi:mannosyltransferase
MKTNLKRLYQRFTSWRGSDWLLLGLGLALLAVLALPTIGKSSIWFDEAFSSYLSKFSFFDIAKYTAADVHPPLYYWTLKIWEMIFGYSDVAIRSMSVFFAAIAAIFAFLTIRRLFGRKAAVLGLLFMVISPMIIRYSQEARMYMMVTAITMAATYTLTYAINSRRRRPWIIYAILVAAGMWTHYFTALVWLAHWAWRFTIVRQTGLRGKELAKKFFSKTWIWTHVFAVGLFAAWLPFMAKQLGGIQGGGFWIGPVGVNTPTNFLTNLFYYQEHDNVQGWLAIILLIVTVGLIVLIVRTYRTLSKVSRQNYLLLILMALVPGGLLMIASLPPATSSYVERYLMTSFISTALLIGVTIVYGLAKSKLRWRIGSFLILVVMFAIGISNVYYYGNYNKNSNDNIRTKQLVQAIDIKAKPGEPIIANSPWIFYEAVFYESKDHPVYFINADTQYLYGSLDMLKDNDAHKITDVPAFLQQHPDVWYIGVTNASSVTSDRTVGWTALQTIGIHDPIRNVTNYQGTEYKTN